ncbi:MAG: potassium channel family protein [Candidatus Acidiferrales bacterium]
MLKRTLVILIMVVVLLALGTFGFHVIEGRTWFESFYATMMTVSTIGGEAQEKLSYQGRIFNVILIFAGLLVIGFAVGSFTRAVVEFQLDEFFGRRRLEKELLRMKDHFIICGAGRVGRRMTTEIVARGLPVVLIEKDPLRAKWAQEKNIPVIVGDASSEVTLRQARIETAKGLASAVTSDAQNVYIVLTARSLRPDLAIVARASEEDAESKLAKAGANHVVSPYHYAGQRMARSLTQPHVQRFIDVALSSLGDEELDLHMEEMQVAEKSALADQKVGDANLRDKFGVIVLAIRHNDGRLQFNPPSDAVIHAGDHLIIMGDAPKLKEIEPLLGPH